MLKSMTGFGKQMVNIAQKKVTIEIRTLNSKQFDINIRLPLSFKDKELDIRNLVSKQLERGKIDVFLNVEQDVVTAAPKLNKSIAQHYYNELKSFAALIQEDAFEAYMPIIAKLPDVFKIEEETVDPEEWEAIYRAFEETVQEVNTFRLEEGKQLEQEFIDRTHEILNLLSQVDQYESGRAERTKERIKTNLLQFLQDVNHDKNRLEQEMIYYIEKLDITEEKVRLKKHCTYFLDTITDKNSSGKKLGFICQEIGREINTLGSKANDAELQTVVVLMKDELEKIKEQLYNIL